ncbi:hypothetical protein H0H81_002290 [Sphagnurus paluster]|uniref:Methyltransferase domain-containing protein n=1 Tax=Sphagnurus paluster TaxID=117069 RepID=A0A9P7FVJ1_9AGAR|nr:hypothetical protein H0H81_002290 [Sphagnurus paluster]
MAERRGAPAQDKAEEGDDEEEEEDKGEARTEGTEQQHSGWETIIVVATLLAIHPNDPQADQIHVFGDTDDPGLVPAIRAAQLPRPPIHLPISIPQPLFGMSPKKHHEVERMTQYIADRVPPSASLRIIDVGAGQGYLTRALHAHFHAPTLALDSDQVQTHGAQARAGPAISAITHRTIHLTPAVLLAAIDDWLPTTGPGPYRLLLVALHACGPLTPDLFRALLSLPATHPWRPTFAIAVGCCYNLMHPPADFPLSAHLRTHPTPLPHPLPASAYQLAAQVPDHWDDSPAARARMDLATRKVVWRALLPRIHPAARQLPTETGSTPALRRLGRLPDAAYADWPTFLARARERLGVDFPHDPCQREPPFPELQERLSALHVRRCLLGPVVESYIVLDRVQWIKEELQARRQKYGEDDFLAACTIEAVNLFDQATGSGRNIALVLAPPQVDTP